MPGNIPKFVLPTGYEDEQLKAERKRKIAQALLERGLTTNPNMQSWVQVLGQLGQTYAGTRLNKKADKIDSDVRARMLSDYGTQTADLDKLAKGGDLSAITTYANSHPMVAEAAKPYVEAFSKMLSEREGIKHTPTGYRRAGDVLNQPEFDPNAMMVPTGQPGEYGVNAARVTAALAAQPNTTISNPQTLVHDPSVMPQQPVQKLPTGEAPQPLPGPQTDPLAPLDPVISTLESGGRDYYPGGAPVVSPKGARFGMQVMPSTAHDPGFGVAPAANESPAEYNRVGRDYAAAMQRRYGNNPQALGAYNGGPGRMDRAIASRGANWMGGLPPETQQYVAKGTSMKPPAGVVNGKPYWIINGQPYDNPEGR